MRKFENYVQYTKYKVLKAVAKSTFNDNLEKDILNIPEEIIKGPKARTRCCIYKERAIIKDRIKLALGGNLDDPNIVEVIDIACDECPVDRFTVTEACRGCLAHKCKDACPVGAIYFVGQRAIIDQEKCIECGKCAAVCPYNAIAEVRRPCITACKADAISIDKESKKAVIDYDSCINCGACSYQCPFGAIMDKSYIVDIARLLMNSQNNKNYKVYALIAPSISSQFTYASIEQIVTGIKVLGFHHIIEAALGADIVAYHETNQVKEEIPEKRYITSSCCPSFVSYIEKKYPELKEHISSAVSPMIAAARFIRLTDPNAKIVFIGPCISKKVEAKKDNYSGDIDYAMTFEELQALLDSKEIKVEECTPGVLDNASYYGRIFARTGGLSDAVKHVAESNNLNIDIKPVLCDGLSKCDKILKLAKFNRLNGNFIEGMACKGGCICGPASLSHGMKDKKEVDKYGKLAKEKDVNDAIKIVDLDKLNLDR